MDEVDDAPEGTLIVRTHGVPPEVVGRARARDLEVVDATCPFVSVAQRKAATLRDAGYAVVILGERDHPEVVGLEGFAGDGAVVVEDADGLPLERLRGKRVGVVVQTTQTRANLCERRGGPGAGRARTAGVQHHLRRHREASERRLRAGRGRGRGRRGRRSQQRQHRAAGAALPRDRGRTHHIESAAELRPEWFAGATRIGVTAGASTPDEEIEATVGALRELVR